jgi:nitroreductase
LPLSSREVDYPEIRAAHAASSLGSGAEAAAWRGLLLPQHGASPTAGEIIPLAADVSHDETIESVILRRGSTRQFTHEPIGFDVLSTILRYVSRDLSADVLARDASATDLYLIVNAVDTLAPGAYLFDRARDALALLRGGEFRREAGHLDLGQDLAADAAVNLYWLVDLHPPLERFGNRGYRAAQLEAAIRGGKTYLAAFALGIGATGLTFFDDDVTEFFSPHAAGKSVMFLMAIGQPAQRQIAELRGQGVLFSENK